MPAGWTTKDESGLCVFSHHQEWSLIGSMRRVKKLIPKIRVSRSFHTIHIVANQVTWKSKEISFPKVWEPPNKEHPRQHQLELPLKFLTVVEYVKCYQKITPKERMINLFVILEVTRALSYNIFWSGKQNQHCSNKNDNLCYILAKLFDQLIVNIFYLIFLRIFHLICLVACKEDTQFQKKKLQFL